MCTVRLLFFLNDIPLATIFVFLIILYFSVDLSIIILLLYEYYLLFLFSSQTFLIDMFVFTKVATQPNFLAQIETVFKTSKQ